MPRTRLDQLAIVFVIISAAVFSGFVSYVVI